MDIHKLWANINLIRSVPAILFYSISTEKITIKKDVNRWVNILGIRKYNYGTCRHISWLLLYHPAFRNLFYNRLKKGKFIIPYLIGFFYPPMQTLYICTNDIGAGLYIQHGFSTIISAKSIGENCWINQQVTIGYSNSTNCPVIESNVRITSGAKVIGGITIGENSIIGANAVVVKNIPPNCTVVGNPSFIVKRNGIRVKENIS